VTRRALGNETIPSPLARSNSALAEPTLRPCPKNVATMVAKFEHGTSDRAQPGTQKVKSRWGMLAMASLCFYAILVNIGILLNPDTPIFTDSPSFLEVVELIAGKYAGHAVPFRIQYPMYPYLTWAMGLVTRDMLFAARLASFVPAVISPLLVYLSCRLIGCGRHASLIGGLLLASAPPLIRMSGVPLYDSLFVFMTAASLTASLAALRSPSPAKFAGAAAICGLAAATRGPGLFFVFALILPIVWMKNLSRATKLRVAALCLATAAGCLLLARYPAKRLAAGLIYTDPACTKQLILDGILYSEGTQIRDAAVYGLDENCVSMGGKIASVCRMRWPEFIGRYGREWVGMVFRNWKRTIYDLTGVLSPFITLFFPVSLGIYAMLRERAGPQQWSIVFMAVPFLLIVPAIQWQSRYFYPLFVIASVVAGLGVQFVLDSLYRTGRVVVVALVALACGAAADAVSQGVAPNLQWRNYRVACEWILTSPKFGPTATVMVRNHGVYAFLHKQTVSMPIASLERTICFARAKGVDAIIVGPMERAHNPNIESPTTEIERTRVFGEGEDRVEVLAIRGSPGDVAR
jgi:hypothetical protein